MSDFFRNRHASTSEEYDNLLSEVETLQNQLNTTSSNLTTLRGTNNKLTDRISQLETTIEDQTVKVNEQEKDAISLRRQLRISSAEITRLRTEKEVLEKEYEDLNSDYNGDREECKMLMNKVEELEQQLAAALHLHVVSENRGAGKADATGQENVEEKKAISWLDLKAKLREAEDELDAVKEERDWLEGQLEKFIHSKEAVGGTLDINLLKPMTSMSSIGLRSTSRASSRGRSVIRGQRKSLGSELGTNWKHDEESESEGSSTTEQADDSDDSIDDENTTVGLKVPQITTTDNDDTLSVSSRKDLKDFALRLDTSGKSYKAPPRALSIASRRAPSVAASLRSRISTRSRRDSDNIHNLDATPPAPVAATAVFHDIERQHDAKVSRLQNDIVELSTDLTSEIELLQQEVDLARAERDECVLEVEKLKSEITLVKAREEDAKASRLALEAMREAEIKELNHTIACQPIGVPIDVSRAIPLEPTERPISSPVPMRVQPPPSVIQIQPVASISIPDTSSNSDLDSLTTSDSESESESEPSTEPEVTVINTPIHLQAISREPTPTLADLAPVTTALEAEFMSLQQRDHERVVEILALRSERDTMARSLREKDTLLRANVVRLERDLEELVRDNRNMKDDAEINHYKVENLADELDRTRELLHVQACERRDLMEQIERLHTRIRDLEREHVMKREMMVSPDVEAAPQSLPVPSTISFALPGKTTKSQLTASTGSDFKYPLSDSEHPTSDSESDAPPPLPVINKRRKSSTPKSGHHRHHKKERKEKAESQVSSSHRRTSSGSKVGKNNSISRRVSQPALSPVASSVSAEVGIEPDNMSEIRPSMLGTRSRSITLPFDTQRPQQTRTQTTPAPSLLPGQDLSDKTYYKDLLVGGYGMPAHEFNKHRRQARRSNLSMQIKVTPRGVESNVSRIGTGGPIGVGNYADDILPEGKRSVRRTRRRQDSRSDGEFDNDNGSEVTYLHSHVSHAPPPGQGHHYAHQKGWFDGLFKK